MPALKSVNAVVVLSIALVDGVLDNILKEQ